MSTPARALLTGQPTLAASAACWNPSASRPSTSPRTVSLIVVIARPLSSRPRVTSAVTSSACGVPPPLPISLDSDMAKHAAWAAAISSSGLVVPPASSAARWGKLTSKVPTLELESSTWPDPSCRVPFQAVRAVRVGMGFLPTGAALSWTARRRGPTRPACALPSARPRSGGDGGGGDALGQQPELGLQVVELAGVEPDGADHLLGDGEGLVPQGPPLVGERDGHRALVLDPAVAGDQPRGGEPLEQR